MSKRVVKTLTGTVYHDPECALVKADDVTVAKRYEYREEARAEGLTQCDACLPDMDIDLEL